MLLSVLQPIFAMAGEPREGAWKQQRDPDGAKAIKEGKTESMLAAELEYFVRKKGGRLSFEPIIAAGINSVYPHAGISARKIYKNLEEVVIFIL